MNFYLNKFNIHGKLYMIYQDKLMLGMLMSVYETACIP